MIKFIVLSISDLKIMINQTQTRTFLKKTKDQFISISVAIRLLKVDKSAALETLTYMETQGFIEKSEVDETYWVMSARGKLLTHKVFPKEFKTETLNKQLENVLERAAIVNTSDKFPDCISCIRITSQYPIENRSDGIRIAYALNPKPITEEQYDKAANQLREEYKGTFGNMIEYLDYPHKAVKLFLQSRSKVLKLKEYSLDDLKKLDGPVIFGEQEFHL